MANKNPPPPPEHGKWKPGESGNPGGSTQGYRRKIQGKFLETLAADFEKHGKAAIEACRTQSPETYVRVCAGLVPKEVEVTRALDEIDDTTLSALIAAVRSIVAPQDAGSGAEAKGGPQQAH